MVEKARIRILLTGKSGMLGQEIEEEFSKPIRQSEYSLYSFPRLELDITNKTSVEDAFLEIKPDIVINCAAYTNVDLSEIHKEEARKVNALGVATLAESCKKHQATLVHFSTDYVFDGNDTKGYAEDAPKHPLNEYGLSKSLGEDAIICTLDSYYIVRTSWLFGNGGKNFIDTMRKKSSEKETKVVNDQFGSPTYAHDLAQAIPNLIKNYPFGIYHLTNFGSCSWFDLARKTFSILHSDTNVLPITSEQFKSAAKRPKCSILLSTKFKRQLPPWEDAVERYLGVHQ